MRWDRLFDDLERQLDAEQREEERALRLEEERLRLARLTLRERILSMSAGDDAGLRIQLHDGSVHLVRPQASGRDWLSGRLRERGMPGRQCVVPFAAIAALLPSAEQLARSLDPQPEPAARLAERIGIAFVLRDLCRRREPVRLTTLDGGVHGTIDRVGRDHLDLAVHEPGVPRRIGEVRQFRIVPMERIVLVAFG